MNLDEAIKIYVSKRGVVEALEKELAAIHDGLDHVNELSMIGHLYRLGVNVKERLKVAEKAMEAARLNVAI